MEEKLPEMVRGKPGRKVDPVEVRQARKAEAAALIRESDLVLWKVARGADVSTGTVNGILHNSKYFPSERVVAKLREFLALTKDEQRTANDSLLRTLEALDFAAAPVIERSPDRDPIEVLEGALASLKALKAKKAAIEVRIAASQAAVAAAAAKVARPKPDP